LLLRYRKSAMLNFTKNLIISLLASAIFLGSCSTKKTMVINGALDIKFVEKLTNAPRASWVKVTSQGGDPEFAYKAAEIILAKKLKLEVQGGCFSSCAEYLLPAATDLKFNNALIGFHQSPPLISKLKTMNSTSKKPICYYEKQVQPLIELQRKTLGVESFWDETLERLKVTEVRIKDLGACIEVGFNFKNKLWIPTSSQLQTLFELSYTGSLCSDNKNCYSNILDRIAPAGTRFIVGEDVYISN